MFDCECHHCGRRELRGPRSLIPRADGWWAICRRCGTDVLAFRGRRAAEPSTQAA